MNLKLSLPRWPLVTTNAHKQILRFVRFLAAFAVTMLLWAAAAEAADINISNPQYPVTPVGDIGWNPGMTHARAIHWAPVNGVNGNDGWYQYWDSCPDDGDCSSFSLIDDQYQADFDIGGSIMPCHPNSGDGVTVPGWEYLPCPLYSNWYGWFGTNTAKEYAAGINNYSWNRWNSPNIWIGLEENNDRSASLRGRRLDNALLSFTLLAYLDRDYVEAGTAPRGQGRITIGFKFIGANGLVYVVEMNMSNMRVNLNDHRYTADYPSAPGAPQIPVSNPWRDDIWAEYIYDPAAIGQDPNPRAAQWRHTYVIGARNWGYNLAEDQSQTIFFDPWWVATVLVWPPSDCPQPLNDDGTQSTNSFDPDGYGVVPCGAQATKYALPYEALFDASGQPAATFLGFYVGVEMAGSAVYGDAAIANWTVQRRW